MKSLIHQSMKNRIVKKASFVMASIVVFATTYSLILPALTLDYDTLSDLPGLHLGQKPVVVEVLNSESPGRSDGDFLSLNSSDTGVSDVESSATDESVSTDEAVIDESEQSASDSPKAQKSNNPVDTHKELLWVHKDADESEIQQAVKDTFGDQVKSEKSRPAKDQSAEENLSQDQSESKDQAIEAENTENETAVDVDHQSTVAASETTELPEADQSVINTPEQVKPTVPEELDGAIFETADDQNVTDVNEANEGTIVEEQNQSDETTENEAVNNTENSITAETQEFGQTSEITTKPENWLQNTANTALNQNVVTLTFDGSDFHVTATGTAIPEGAVLDVQEIVQGTDEFDGYEQATKEHLSDPNAEVVSQRFFDISFLVDGAKVEPTEGVTVQIQFDEAQEVKENQKLSVVHFADTASTADDPAVTEEKQIENVDGVVVETSEPEKAVEPEINIETKAEVAEVLTTTTAITEEGMIEGVSFETGSFSVFGVVYTVDFHWEVDGQMYEYSLPGGGFVSFRKLVEVLGIVDATHSEGEEASDSTIDEFINDVEKVEFSDESLVKVAAITEESGNGGITAGALKEKLGVESEYSAELTEAQIEEINSQVFYPVDWALISLKAFTSEEYLTVTLKTGEVFTITVTDAQIKKEYISDKGDTWEITVTYDDDAEIPDGSDLEVRELLEGTSEYKDYINNSANELGTETDDISFARFFDITIVDKDGAKVEPKTPVTVQIKYKDAIEIGEEEHLSVVHFADKGTEVIDNVNLNAAATTVTYAQDSFSVTGTIVTGGPRNGNVYMLVVEYEGVNYIINNDGTLTPVADINASQISTDSPMMWTYYYEYGGHFRFASEASGFNSDQTASGYYYRYLDPNSATGITEEDSGHPHLENSTQINYNGNKVSSVSNNNYYIGISNEGGTLHVTGQSSSANAALIKLYSANDVNPALPANHTVNHIDISISGSAQVNVPLAYGIYYYKDGDTWKKIIVGNNVEDIDDGIELGHARYANKTESLEADNIGIKSEDMKKAVITATDKNGNVVDNAFYITGYSANETTAYSTDQVRIEGSFKVSTIDPVANNWYDINSEDTRHRRKADPINYTVTATKSLEMDLIYEDLETHRKFQLYQSTDESDKMTITAEVPLTASFNYWDYGKNNGKNDGNECPPLQESWGYTREWQDGGIHPWGISGMDFVLKANVTNVPAKIAAVEITKKIIDGETGEVIEIGSDNVFSSQFGIYQDVPGNPNTVRELGSEVHNYDTYAKRHDRNIKINSNGIGHIYDYNMKEGMTYVEESRDFPVSFTVGGDTYTYVRTDIRTEYAWRDNAYNGQKHTKTVTNRGVDAQTGQITNSGKDLSAIPEVVGDYKSDQGENLRNEFLTFEFDNVYIKNATPPPPEPETRSIELELEKKFQDGTTIKDDVTGSVTFVIRRFTNNNTQPDSESEFKKTIIVDSDHNWKLTIPDLPVYVSDGTTTTTYKYYLVETARSGAAEPYNHASFTDGIGSQSNPVTSDKDGVKIPIEVTDKSAPTIKIQKRWLAINPDTAPAVTVKLWRQLLKNGNPEGAPTLVETFTLSNDDRVEDENWWQIETSYPTDVPPEGSSDPYNTYSYGYFITEDDPNRQNTTGQNEFQNPKFNMLVGDQTMTDMEAFNYVYVTQLNGTVLQQNNNTRNFGNQNWGEREGARSTVIQDTTLMVLNSPGNTFDNAFLMKTWYVKNAAGQIVAATDDTVSSQYAIGLQIYQREKNNPDSELFPYGNEFYVARSTDVIDNNGSAVICDNAFKVNENKATFENGKWKIALLGQGGQIQGFPKWGFKVNENGNYIMGSNGQYETVVYEYVVKETGIYTGNHARTAEDLTRTLDYTNVKDWTFDNDHKGSGDANMQGINYPSSHINVTKDWKGGHEGSQIYFKIYQQVNGNDIVDITTEIVNDPESYGLSVHQVFRETDGSDPTHSHDAIIVRYLLTDGEYAWETVEIKGLQTVRFNSNSQHQGNCSYSIKEIGYSEPDGTNYFNGDSVTNPDGTTGTFNISGLLTGYQINNGTSEGGETSTPVTVTSSTAPLVKIFNQYEEKYKDLVFTKIWQEAGGTFTSWKDSIYVDIYANDSKITPENGLKLFIIPEQGDTNTFTWNGITYTWSLELDASGTIYTFRVPGLPAKLNGTDCVYKVEERNLEGYSVSYGQITDEPVQETDETGNPVVDDNNQPVYKIDPYTHEVVTRKVFSAGDNQFILNGGVISNKKDEPQTGALKITKAVTVNDETPTDANKAKTNGTFEFTVAGIADTDTAGITHTVKITFVDGKATKYQIDTEDEKTVTGEDNTWAVVLENLTPGQYTITETAPTINGMSLKTVTGGNSVDTSKVVTVTVTAGDASAAQTAAQVVFTNNYTEYEVVIVKVDTGNTSTKLGGAEFDLYASASVEEKDGKTVPKNDATPINGSTKLVSSSTEGDGKGKVSLGNLAAGTYYLFETKAPAGYVPMDMPVTITVADGRVSLMQGTREETKTVSDNTMTNAKAELTVMNSAGVELPATGGPGTMLIYGLGAVVAEITGYNMLCKRRKKYLNGQKHKIMKKRWS